jgi:hypothetical protein
MHNESAPPWQRVPNAEPREDKQPEGGKQSLQGKGVEYRRNPASCMGCTLQKPREWEKAREGEEQGRTTGGRQRAAGVEFPRAVCGDPLTSSPARAAPHSGFERDTRAAPRSAQAGCSGGRPAGQPCQCPEMHGSIRQPRAGPRNTETQRRGQLWTATCTARPRRWLAAGSARRLGDIHECSTRAQLNKKSERLSRDTLCPRARGPPTSLAGRREPTLAVRAEGRRCGAGNKVATQPTA